MKIYFDARMIDHPGIGRYIRCLLPFIAEDRSIELSLLGNRSKIKGFISVRAEMIEFNHPIYSVQEQVGFLGLKRIVRGDILHVPHYNIPVLAKFRLVTTVHDLMHILYPEGASGKLAPLYMRFMMGRIVKTASGVICVSEATRKLLEEIEKGKKGFDYKGDMRVIHEGADKIFTKMADADYLKGVKEKYKLPDRFLLYVGSIRRHKNIGALLSAFEYFRKKNAGISLVMVGRYGQDIDIKKDGVMYLGELASDRELSAVYNLASCLFNLSLHEGFGLTVLEAQACGLPVVCSHIPVHAEVGNGGVMLVDPSYIDQIYENLYNVLFNSDKREALISRGLENVRRFDWQSTARKTIDLYRKIYDEGSDSSRLAAGNARRGKDPKCLLQNISSG